MMNPGALAMTRPALLFLLLPLVACAAQTPIAETPAAAPATADASSGLPTRGFVRGRPATTDDLAHGDALFVAQASSGRTSAVDVVIPQYVRCNEKDGGSIAGILVQAEEAQGMTMAGVRKLADGKGYVALLSSCTLLGTARP